MTRRPPNFLFLFPDQLRPDWIGPVSDLPVCTPTIDRLAEEGVLFRNCYSNSPLCAPVRACLASGRRYERCGVPNNGYDYPLDQTTYYQLLRNVGYRVAGCGKFDLHKATLDWGLDGQRLLSEWGFTDGVDNEGKFDGSISYRRSGGPKGPYLKALSEAGYAEDYVREHARNKEKKGAYTTIVPDELYCDNWLCENGLAALNEIPVGTPWHLVVNFTGPHNPMDVTPSMASRFEGVVFPPPHANEQSDYTADDHQRNRRNYAAMIENIDRQADRFLQAIEKRGELDNTIVIFSSDHGEMLGDHGAWGKGTWRWPSVQVPLVVRAPGGCRGYRSDALVSTHDLSATILDYAGVPPADGMDAKSIRPLVEGRLTDHRDYALAGLDTERTSWRLISDGRHKLVVQDHRRMLFDLENDPWEDSDIAESSGDVVKRLWNALEDRGV